MGFPGEMFGGCCLRHRAYPLAAQRGVRTLIPQGEALSAESLPAAGGCARGRAQDKKCPRPSCPLPSMRASSLFRVWLSLSQPLRVKKKLFHM